MPYSDTKTQLRKDLAAGKFQQEGKGFLSDVADMYMDYALRSMLAEESDERAAKKAAEKDRKTKIANSIKEAKAKEAQARDYQRKATNLLRDVGFAEQLENPNFIKVAMEQIYAAEGNYNSALTRMETLKLDGRLNVLDPKIGPLMPGLEPNLDAAIASTDRAIEAEIAEGGIENSDTAQAVYDMAGQQLSRGAFRDALEEQMSGIMGSLPLEPAPNREVTGFRAELRSSESSGDPTAVDFNKADGKDHVGLYQFGQARLDEVNAALGTKYTLDDIKAGRVSAEEQERLADWHFSDIDQFIEDKGLDKFIGTEINGATITRAGMAAVAHLGGKNGLEQFLMSDGDYDRSDGQTKLSDYMKRFENSEYTTAQMDELSLGDDETGLMIAPVAEPALIDWSKVTKDGYQTYAQTLRQQGKSDEANKVIKFGDETFKGTKTDTLTEAKYAALYASNAIKLASTNEDERKEAEAWFKNEEPKLASALRRTKAFGEEKDPVFITTKSGQKIEAVENEDGSFTAVGNNQVYKAADIDSIETAERLGLQIDLYNDLKTQMKDQRELMASAVSATVQGYNLVELAKQNEAVLTLVGSGVATVEGAAKELQALMNLLGGGAEGASQSAVLSKMNSYIDEIQGIDPELAADYRQFAAAMTRYVYASGKALGQTGNGFSDKDFKNLRDAMFAGKGIEEFENNIRTFSKERLDEASRAALGLQGSQQVQLLQELGGSYGTDLLKADDYIAAVTLEGDPDYYAWAYATQEPQTSEVVETPQTADQAISDYNSGKAITITAELKLAYPDSPTIQNAPIGSTIKKAQ